MRLLSRLLLVGRLCLRDVPHQLRNCPRRGGGTYRVTALRPKNPSNVKVKLSTSTQHIYVMEGDRLLMAVQGTVGANNTHADGQLPDHQQDQEQAPHQPAGCRLSDGLLVRVQAGLWLPRRLRPSAPALARLHPPAREAAARLFALVRSARRCSIATSQPEDSKYGHLVRKLDQSRDPDPPRSLLMSPAWFKDPPGPLLVDG